MLAGEISPASIVARRVINLIMCLGAKYMDPKANYQHQHISSMQNILLKLFESVLLFQYSSSFLYTKEISNLSLLGAKFYLLSCYYFG